MLHVLRRGSYVRTMLLYLHSLYLHQGPRVLMDLCQGPRVSTENTYLQQYIISVRTFLIPIVLFYDVNFFLSFFLWQGPRVSPEFCQRAHTYRII